MESGQSWDWCFRAPSLSHSSVRDCQRGTEERERHAKWWIQQGRKAPDVLSDLAAVPLSLSFTSPSRVGRDCGAGLTREQGLKTEQLGSTWSLTPQYLAT